MQRDIKYSCCMCVNALNQLPAHCFKHQFTTIRTVYFYRNINHLEIERVVRNDENVVSVRATTIKVQVMQKVLNYLTTFLQIVDK